MTVLDHVHKWVAPVFRDFCHYTQKETACKDPDCDVVRIQEVERDFGLNPLQIAFADPTCPECRRLAKGHEPDAWVAEELRFP